jgi:hypothetical protein
MRLSNIHDDDEYEGLEDVDEFEDEFDPADVINRATSILSDAEVDILDAGYEVWQIGLDYTSGDAIGQNRLEVENPNGGPNIIVSVMPEHVLYVEGGNLGGDTNPDDLIDMIEQIFAELDEELAESSGEYEDLEDVDTFSKVVDDHELRMMAQEFVNRLNGKHPITPERILEEGGYQTDELGFIEIDELPDVRGNPTFTIQTEDLIQYYKVWWFPGTQTYDQAPDHGFLGKDEYVGGTDSKWMLERRP